VIRALVFDFDGRFAWRSKRSLAGASDPDDWRNQVDWLPL